jgi:hypothetical protein
MKHEGIQPVPQEKPFDPEHFLVNIRTGNLDDRVIYSVHHDSSSFRAVGGLKLANRTALTRRERKERCDYGSRFTVPQNGGQRFVSERTRLFGDLNRAPDHPGLFVEESSYNGKNLKVWKPGQELTKAEKEFLFREVWSKYHAKLAAAVGKLDGPGLVVGWDNTEKNIIGKDEAGRDVEMPAIILSNGGLEGSPTNPEGIVTNDPDFMLELLYQLQLAFQYYNIPGHDNMFLNLVYRGGYVPKHYNSNMNQELGTNHKVQSVQIEYNTDLTHDQDNLKPDAIKIERLRKAAERAMYQTVTGMR